VVRDSGRDLLLVVQRRHAGGSVAPNADDRTVVCILPQIPRKLGMTALNPELVQP
jgi:hypothetical protein